MTTKVLLIEDDNTMVTLLDTLLRFEGFEVTQIDNDDTLDNILDIIRRERPTMILLDVYLRKISGFDLLHCIRHDEYIKDTGVIMSSGIDFRERCLREGANEFILKPYLSDELVFKIRQIIGEKTSYSRE